jgi:hypothetical protein
MDRQPPKCEYMVFATPACCHEKNEEVKMGHRRLCRLWMAGCFCLVLAAARGSPAAELAGAEALQAAVEDLRATFGGRYPGGPGYLDRLGQLRREAQEASGQQAEKLQARFDVLKRELSPCLAKFADPSDPAYQEALTLIRAGRERLANTSRADMPNFHLTSLPDLSRQSRLDALAGIEMEMRQAIIQGRKCYEILTARFLADPPR